MHLMAIFPEIWGIHLSQLIFHFHLLLFWTSIHQQFHGCTVSLSRQQPMLYTIWAHV